MPFAHQRWINGLQSVPDAFGRPALLAWSYDGRVCLWDAQTGANIAAIEHERVVEHAAWIADVDKVATLNPRDFRRAYPQLADKIVSPLEQ